MCHFVSWIESDDGKLLYLTNHDVYHTTKGKLLRNYIGWPSDLRGHGAIICYFGLNASRYFSSSSHRECILLDNPSELPPEIAQAIRDGKFRGIGLSLDLLSNDARIQFLEQTESYGNILFDCHWDRFNFKQRLFWDLFADPQNRSKPWR